MSNKEIEDLGFTLTDKYKSPYTGRKFPIFEKNIEVGFNTGVIYVIEVDPNGFRYIKQHYGSYANGREEMRFGKCTLEELKTILKLTGCTY